MRDGENLFEHLSLGRVFSRSTNVFIDRFDVFMTLSAVVLVPAAIFGALIGLGLGIEEMKHPDDEEAQSKEIAEFIQQHSVGLLFAFVVHSLIRLFTTLVGEGGMVRACADIYAGEPQPWLAAAKAGAAKFCTLLLASMIVLGVSCGGAFVVYAIIIMAAAFNSGLLGFLAVISAIVYLVLLCLWISQTRFIFPVIMIENKGAVNSVRRSFEISKGRQCYIFCACFILWVAKVLVAQLLHNIFSGDSLMAAFLSPGGIIISFIPDLIFLPVNSILKTVLYASVRVDKEGLTEAVLKRELVEPVIYSPPNTDYRQVSLMDESNDAHAAGLTSDFA